MRPGKGGYFFNKFSINCQQDFRGFFSEQAKCSGSFKWRLVAAWLLHSHLCAAALKLTATPEQPPPD